LTPEVFAGAARLPGFHTCVGANDELLTTKWYKEQGSFFWCSLLDSMINFMHCILANAMDDGIFKEHLIVRNLWKLFGGSIHMMLLIYCIFLTFTLFN
jgi:hypothetical protein